MARQDSSLRQIPSLNASLIPISHVEPLLLAPIEPCPSHLIRLGQNFFRRDEWGVMRRHPQIGQQILTQARGQLGLVSHIVVAHHERWDGQGYPYGLAQQEIPLGARLLSVIDTYDAMTSARPYREALSAAEAREELQRCAGSQFDPQVVAVFLQTLQAQESQGSIVPVSTSL